MTPEELAEVEERCRKATPGPWTTIYRHWEAIDGQKYASEAEFPCLVMAVHECEDHPIADASCNHTCRLDYEASDNAAFIAHARADVPALVAEVRRLREENERLNRTSLPHMCRDGHEEIRHAGDGELCPVCEAKNEAERARGDCDAAVHAAQANTAELARAWQERDDALAEVARLREALDAAQRIVKRKADREAGREET